MRNLLLVLEYDGTHYAGWQRQPQRRTIQGVLEEKLTSLLGQPVKVLASGRTDAGVHALGQVVTFTTDNPMSCDKVQKALQALLPQDIRVVNIQEVSLDFHPRKSAKRKRYVYALWYGKGCPAFLRKYLYPWDVDLNWDVMREGVQLFLGQHDFSSFSSPSPRSSRRTVFSFEFRFRKPPVVTFEIEADGFLYHMVRMIIGETLLLGMGRKSLSDLELMLEHPSYREYRRLNLPPQGLYLMEVVYEEINPYEGLKLEDAGFVVPVWVREGQKLLKEEPLIVDKFPPLC